MNSRKIYSKIERVKKIERKVMLGLEKVRLYFSGSSITIACKYFVVNNAECNIIFTNRLEFKINVNFIAGYEVLSGSHIVYESDKCKEKNDLLIRNYNKLLDFINNRYEF